MYKKISLWLLALGIIFSVPYAKADIQDVSFRYCDDTGDKYFMEWKRNFMITPGQETEICLTFSTNSETERKIIYWFTEGRLTPSGTPMCFSDKGPNNWFSKFFSNTWERVFNIKKDAPISIKEKINIPLGISGTLYGCLAYSLGAPEVNNASGWMFNIVVNKSSPISLFIGQGGDIKHKIVVLKNSWGEYTTNKEIKAIINQENRLQLELLLKNEWNVGEAVELTGSITNILWFEKTFSATITKLTPGAEQTATVDVGNLPFYKGPFTVYYTLNYTPKFEFDASSLEDNLKKWGTITWSAQIYIFSWISLIIILAILGIIVKFFWPRKKIVVQA